MPRRSSRSTTTCSSTTAPGGRCWSCATASTPGSCGRSPQLRVGRDEAGHDVLLLTGPEPDMAWHRFAGAVGDLAVQLGVATMVGLGAYPFAAPHTRPPRLSATSPSADVLAGLPFRTARRRAGRDVGGARARLHERGIPASGIWAQVPHYVPRCRTRRRRWRCSTVWRRRPGSTSTTAELRREAVLQRERLDQLVEANEEHQAMVAQFERMYDAAEGDRPDDGRPRAAHRRRARRRGRALPARPRTEVGPPAMKVDGGIGRTSTGPATGSASWRRRLLRSVDGRDQPRPVPAAAARRRAHRRRSSSARRSPSPSPATR